MGVEIENFIYDKNLRRIPIDRDDRPSSMGIKERLDTLNAQADISPNLSIEPGGQIEYASRPYTDLHGIHREWQAYLANLIHVCNDEDLIFLDLSMEPIYRPEEIPLIHMKKYQLLHTFWATTGTAGHRLMKNSTSVQVNLDYVSIEEASRLAYTADCLQPFLSVIFANSPFLNGETTGKGNVRLESWHNTDSRRCGSLLDHGIIRSDGLIEDFAALTATAPTIYTVSKTDRVEPFDGTLGEWLEKLHNEEQLDQSDVLVALHQIFTHVRFKDILELRVTDRPPLGYELAPAAFVTGLLRSPEITDRLWETVLAWPAEERLEVNSKAALLDLSQKIFDGRSFHHWIERLFEMALLGLDKRAETMNIASERIYLEPFAEDFLASGPLSFQIQAEFSASAKSLGEFLRERWLSQRESMAG